MARDAEKLVCPVCETPFAGETRCLECGADLSGLMRVAARSHQFQVAALHKLQEGEFGLAASLGRLAQESRNSKKAAKLRLLTAWLAETLHPQDDDAWMHESGEEDEATEDAETAAEEAPKDTPAPKRRRRPKSTSGAGAKASDAETPAEDEEKPAPRRRKRRRTPAKEESSSNGSSGSGEEG